MLMEPVRRWDEEAVRPPIDADARPAFFPKKRVAFPGKNHDVRARSVPMTSRVSTGRILLEVRAHRIASQVESNSRGSLTAQTSIFEAEIAHVRDEIGLPCPVARHFPALAVVIPCFAVEPVAEFKPVAENEVEIAETIDHLRRVRERDQAGGFASLCIEVLLPGVEGRRKKTPLLPLK